jgi:hypothetical protein
MHISGMIARPAQHPGSNDWKDDDDDEEDGFCSWNVAAYLRPIVQKLSDNKNNTVTQSLRYRRVTHYSNVLRHNNTNKTKSPEEESEEKVTTSLELAAAAAAVRRSNHVDELAVDIAAASNNITTQENCNMPELNPPSDKEERVPKMLGFFKEKKQRWWRATWPQPPVLLPVLKKRGWFF